MRHEVDRPGVYVDVAPHGSGAGSALLSTVSDPGEAVAWWVADRHLRTHAFMRKHGKHYSRNRLADAHLQDAAEAPVYRELLDDQDDPRRWLLGATRSGSTSSSGRS